MITLGIDTSNYTTSCALYDSEKRTVLQKKRLLPVKAGEKGIRQSDAVFHHTVQLQQLMQELFAVPTDISAVGVSDKPRDVQGSYMPCFLTGLNAAKCIGAVTDKPVYTFSHQAGHMAAALYSANALELMNKEFIAFHVSGGTTEMLLASPNAEKGFNVRIIGGTGDLNAGQAIDRAGVMMGLSFPCGKELEALALTCSESFNPKISIKDGACSFSGLENQCRQKLTQGVSKSEIARYCFDYIGKTLEKLTEYAFSQYGEMPVVFAGGVSSNSIIKARITSKFNAEFASPEFSCDNAAGTALLAAFREGAL